MKTLKRNLQYSTFLSEAGAIRAASQSLASVALAQSKEEAANILRPSPKKQERPVINLCDKVKSAAEVKSFQDGKLPSRKLVETDNIMKRIEAQVPSPKPKLPSQKVSKIDLKSPKNDQQISKHKVPNEPSKQATTPTTVKRKLPVTPSSSVSQCSLKEHKRTSNEALKTGKISFESRDIF